MKLNEHYKVASIDFFTQKIIIFPHVSLLCKLIIGYMVSFKIEFFLFIIAITKDHFFFSKLLTNFAVGHTIKRPVYTDHLS